MVGVVRKAECSGGGGGAHLSVHQHHGPLVLQPLHGERGRHHGNHDGGGHPETAGGVRSRHASVATCGRREEGRRRVSGRGVAEWEGRHRTRAFKTVRGQLGLLFFYYTTKSTGKASAMQKYHYY